VALRNADVAAGFDEVADLLEIQGENPFRVRAYRNAARVVRDLPHDVAEMVSAGEDLTELPGIGEDLAGQIERFVKTGESEVLSRLRKKAPAGITQLLRLPSLGPKRVRTLRDRLHIRSLDELGKAVEKGRLVGLPGFGPKTAERIREALKAQAPTAGRLLLAVAAQYARPLVAYLAKAPGASRAEVAGSFRRFKETVGDLDILVCAPSGPPVMDHLARWEDVERVVARGEPRATVVLRSGLQVDVRVVPAECFGAALVYFTGSKAHNIEIRRLAQEKGLKISEYGVFRERARGRETRVAGETEESVYAALALPFIPPELRENLGEVKAAAEGRLPKRLVSREDLRGDLHCHTDATDGRASLEEMARGAEARGLSYLAITDHSPHLAVTRGLTPARLRAQRKLIEKVQRKLERTRLLAGIEVDVLEDGSLDLPAAALRELDVVVAAVHTGLRLPREKQTARILRALDDPNVDVLAHPTGRLMPEREPYDVDMERVLTRAEEAGVAVELNAHPERMDLSDAHCRMAKELGVLVAIDSDAHAPTNFDNLAFAAGQARRGWLETGDVLNTRPVAELTKLFRG